MTTIPNDQTIDQNILQKYQIIKKLGSGAYGHVWKVLSKCDKKQYALKKVYSAFQNNLDSQRTYRQISILTKLKNQNIVQLKKVYKAINDFDLYLLFQLVQSDLFKAIKGNFLNQIHKKYIIYQLAKTLKYIHSGGILHRDIKPSNILIDINCKIKLCDFGLSRTTYNYNKEEKQLEKQLNKELEKQKEKEKSISRKNLSANTHILQPIITEFIATRWYRAPEVMMGSQSYNSKADIWSFGCLIYQMYAQKALLPGKDNVDQIQKLLQFKGYPSQQQKLSLKVNNIDKILGHFSTEKKLLTQYFSRIQDVKLKMLLLEIFQYNPQKRPSAEQILKHPFLEQFLNYEKEEVMSKRIRLEHNQSVKLDSQEYKNLIYTKFCQKQTLIQSLKKISQKNIQASQKSIQQRRSIVDRTFKHKYTNSISKNQQSSSPMMIAMPANIISSSSIKKNQNQSNKKIDNPPHKQNKLKTQNTVVKKQKIKSSKNLQKQKQNKQIQTKKNIIQQQQKLDDIKKRNKIQKSHHQSTSKKNLRHSMDEKQTYMQENNNNSLKIKKRSIKFNSIHTSVPSTVATDSLQNKFQIKKNKQNFRPIKDKQQATEFIKRQIKPQIQILKSPSIVYYDSKTVNKIKPSTIISNTAPSSPKKTSSSHHHNLSTLPTSQQLSNVLRKSSSTSFHIKNHSNITQKSQKNPKKIISLTKSPKPNQLQTVNQQKAYIINKPKLSQNKKERTSKMVTENVGGGDSYKYGLLSLHNHHQQKTEGIKSHHTSSTSKKNIKISHQSLHNNNRISSSATSKLPQLNINKNNNHVLLQPLIKTKVSPAQQPQQTTIITKPRLINNISVSINKKPPILEDITNNKSTSVLQKKLTYAISNPSPIQNNKGKIQTVKNRQKVLEQDENNVDKQNNKHIKVKKLNKKGIAQLYNKQLDDVK